MGNPVQPQAFIQKRVASVDALRGFDMFWIAGGENIFRAIYKVWPNATTQALNTQFEHVAWAGFRFYDLIFALFVFMMGVVLPFSLTRRMEAGANRGQLYRHTFQRFVLLFLFGLVYNGLLDFNLHQLRIPGVLQRIAICYLVAALVMMNTGIRGQAIVAGSILIGYWLIMKLVPVPGIGAGVLTPEGNLSGYLDRLIIPFKMCCYTFGDNEGILSTLPAISTCLLGVLAGHWLRSGKYTPNRKVLGLAAAGLASLFVAWVWSFNFPIIKNIWSSTFVLWAGGWSMLLLALFYWIIDVRGCQRWSFYFKVIGMNSITIYLADRFFDFGSITKIFLHGLMPAFGQIAPLVWTCTVIFTAWLFLYFLYRQKIFLRV
ncbi:MAG: acyltransferase family protein [Terriglobia bacterium]